MELWKNKATNKKSRRNISAGFDLIVNQIYPLTSSLIAEAILKRTVRTMKPIENTPKVIRSSVLVGAYSVYICIGDGTNPPEIMPSPLSIHVPAKTIMQRTGKIFMLLRNFGITRSIAEPTMRIREVLIHGTRLFAPWLPKNR